MWHIYKACVCKLAFVIVDAASVVAGFLKEEIFWLCEFLE